ncbi:MAG: aminodeoxychorismate lyase [Gammaproteobacteria bacterium]|nr:aminodeoxychorismate lyase [Gammaproteobacteria bacterium]
MLINGSSESSISVLDRGLQYGDGLFETIAVAGGEPCLWQRHMRRLAQGCERLNIEYPDSATVLEEVYREIQGRPQGVIKIILTRGSGGRGYCPPEIQSPTRLVYFSEWPNYSEKLSRSGVRIRICNIRLGQNPALAGLKTLNRLEQVLARAEWSNPEIAEGLMLDEKENLVEGTMSNLFLVYGDCLATPDLGSCGVSGIMRELVMEQAKRLSLSLSEQNLTLRDLASADGLFLSNSLIGIWPVREVEGKKINPAAVPSPLIDAVMKYGFRFGT